MVHSILQMRKLRLGKRMRLFKGMHTLNSSAKTEDPDVSMPVSVLVALTSVQ